MHAGPERDEVLRQRQAPGRQIPRHAVELRDLFRNKAADTAEPLKGAREPAGVKRRQTPVRAVLAGAAAGAVLAEASGAPMQHRSRPRTGWTLTVRQASQPFLTSAHK
jgi:hypothetical protein